MVLPDYLRAGLKLVFCGTAAGERSAQLGRYYAKPGNRFWRALHEAGFTGHLLLPSEDETLLSLGIGLTDLSKTGRGMDSGLKPGDFDAALFRSKVETLAPSFVAFTSKRAGHEYFGLKRVAYGLQEEAIGKTAIFVLPSPSGAARGYWDIGPWKTLARAAGFVV
ncbi:mismatch-specific DNA-glycosylase [Terrihabitans soli]|uniref:Mismatch-specific DNA-glycosylase n=1 Tax=Terrihabitans soli TaxID=708113 RepID=A0A6S6QLV9_9HYPH|nr:mismatch-specific DNA-glycosylase [Terrihabitans soli]BCJ89889.1 mismatch-specific DNA-glycosylase [Terrihabitans soli]